jgi:hypothetical protein
MKIVPNQLRPGGRLGSRSEELDLSISGPLLPSKADVRMDVRMDVLFVAFVP